MMKVLLATSIAIGLLAIFMEPLVDSPGSSHKEEEGQMMAVSMDGDIEAVSLLSSSFKLQQASLQRMEDSSNFMSQRPCKAQAQPKYVHLSVRDRIVGPVTRAAFDILRVQRAQCQNTTVTTLLTAEMFLSGTVPGLHLRAAHKYASDCSGRTIKLAVVVTSAAGEPMGFHAYAHQTFHKNKDGTYTNDDDDDDPIQVLETIPHVCHIGRAQIAPQLLPISSTQVLQTASSAADQLARAMRQAGCLGAEDKLELDRVKAAASEISDINEDRVTMMLLFKLTQNGTNVSSVANLTVVISCNDVTCKTVLDIAPQAVCSTLKNLANASIARIFGFPTGHVDPDPTEDHVLLKNYFLRLSQSNSSLSLLQAFPKAIAFVRLINDSSTPPVLYDPRSHPCMANMKPFDQGSCGDCYAQALAFMIGARKCFADNGMPSTTDLSSPWQDGLSNASAPKTVDGFECARTWTWGGQPCTNYCCNPSLNSGGNWCMLRTPTQTAPNFIDGPWQWGYCKTSASAALLPAPDPWSLAWTKYMPSVTDVAGSSGYGCGGSSPIAVWNNWMRSLNRQLWTIGPSCLPDELRCMGVAVATVNNNTVTSSGLKCSQQSAWPFWDKDCSCMAAANQPASAAAVAPTSAPSSSCGLDVPSAFFSVMVMGNGLSNAAAVLNMQKHILEFGPIVVCVNFGTLFMLWNYATNPVYTGGDALLYGHCMAAFGWGNTPLLGYWLLRNSWGDTAGPGDQGNLRWQRGTNLGNIERTSPAAVMPVASYADWSLPSCIFSSWGLGGSWNAAKHLVNSYTITLSWTCAGPASISFSFTPCPYRSVSSAAAYTSSTAGQTAETTAINMVALNCVLNGTTVVGLTATGANGLTFSTSMSIAAPVLW